MTMGDRCPECKGELIALECVDVEVSSPDNCPFCITGKGVPMCWLNKTACMHLVSETFPKHCLLQKKDGVLVIAK